MGPMRTNGHLGILSDCHLDSVPRTRGFGYRKPDKEIQSDAGQRATATLTIGRSGAVPGHLLPVSRRPISGCIRLFLAHVSPGLRVAVPALAPEVVVLPALLPRGRVQPLGRGFLPQILVIPLEPVSAVLGGGRCVRIAATAQSCLSRFPAFTMCGFGFDFLPHFALSLIQKREGQMTKVTAGGIIFMLVLTYLLVRFDLIR
jgi:hypothetical protein